MGKQKHPTANITVRHSAPSFHKIEDVNGVTRVETSHDEANYLAAIGTTSKAFGDRQIALVINRASRRQDGEVTTDVGRVNAMLATVAGARPARARGHFGGPDRAHG